MCSMANLISRPPLKGPRCINAYTRLNPTYRRTACQPCTPTSHATLAFFSNETLKSSPYSARCRPFATETLESVLKCCRPSANLGAMKFRGSRSALPLILPAGGLGVLGLLIVCPASALEDETRDAHRNEQAGIAGESGAVKCQSKTGVQTHRQSVLRVFTHQARPPRCPKPLGFHG